MDFARRNRIAFREDATNRSVDIARNRVRRQLLPLLRRRFQANIDEAVLRSMELVRAEAEFVAAESAAWIKDKRVAFARLPFALQRRVLQIELVRAGIAPEFERLEQLRRRENEWIAVRTGLVCRRTSDGQIETRGLMEAPFSPDEKRIELGTATRAAFGNAQISWRLVRLRRRPRIQPDTEFFDADAVGPRVVLRHWRAGDRLEPIGLGRSAKLQDLFVNQKIPRERRHRLLVAASEAGEIFWVEGLRIGERFKVAPQTKRILRWQWKR